MKFLIPFLVLFSMSTQAALPLWRGTTLPLREIEKRWGKIESTAHQFKTGDPKTRASMAASLLKRQKEFKGKPVQSIRELLGPNDGFYFTDVYPAYFIQVGRNHSEETWQIVFLLDRERHVDEIVVHKNCCDSSR